MARMTPQQKRDRIMDVAYARAKAELGFKTDKDLANFLGVNQSWISINRKTHFMDVKFEKLCEIARKMKFTPQEWCGIAGI